MQNIFTYGSLMYEEIWQRVVRGNYKKTDGILYGYNRISVWNEDYPALVTAGSDSRVSGVIYKNISHKDIIRLDAFEGEYYTRETAQAVLSENQTLDVSFYLLKPECRHILSDKQ
jgi:gamma-glutamylcyclotransferase (GGCT)/AIG2-like uncharacterized protein YtfP